MAPKAKGSSPHKPVKASPSKANSPPSGGGGAKVKKPSAAAAGSKHSKKQDSIVLEQGEKMSDKIKQELAADGHRDAKHEQHSGSSANMAAAKGAKYKDFLSAGATKTMSGEASIKPAGEFEALAKEYEDRAAEVESHVSDAETLVSRFGAVLVARKVGKLDERAAIVMDWDKNSDGKISLMEFRQQVKGVGIVEKDVHNIDNLFKQWDKDGSGFLDLSELRVAFKQAIVEANEVEAKARDVRERAATLRRLGALAAEAMERTGELEDEERILADMREKRGASLEEKIGAKLAQRNTHIADMVVADVNGDGVMDKSEFLEFARGVGIPTAAADDDALYTLYGELDKDGSGTLDVSELKESLKRLQSAASKSAGDLADQAELVAQMVRIVGRLQGKFHKERSTLEEELAATATEVVSV